ncbi:MAG TPA: hypothetical protein VFM14_17980 [Gemmatimonadales bacterium]|nr:hypothetical protein [Gemmatimonadales bacterium]
MTNSSLPLRRANPAAIVLAGGLVAGTFDIIYACTYWAIKRDLPAQRILQSVASGLLGKTAFDGGVRTAALGLALHYFIAISMAFTYYVVAQRWAFLREKAVVAGIAYGLLLYVIMNYIVVPLSRAGPGAKDPLWIGLSVLVHALLIGLPIALFTRRALSPAAA